jgi:chromosome segregation ATPase
MGIKSLAKKAADAARNVVRDVGVTVNPPTIYHDPDRHNLQVLWMRRHELKAAIAPAAEAYRQAKGRHAMDEISDLELEEFRGKAVSAHDNYLRSVDQNAVICRLVHSCPDTRLVAKRNALLARKKPLSARREAAKNKIENDLRPELHNLRVKIENLEKDLAANGHMMTAAARDHARFEIAEANRRLPEARAEMAKQQAEIDACERERLANEAERVQLVDQMCAAGWDPDDDPDEWPVINPDEA